MKQTLLTLFLIILPMIASADDSGSCGDGVTYNYVSSTNTLTISKTADGTGMMNDFISDSPWNSYKTEIIRIIIENGVTSIGSGAFWYCNGLTSVTIPNSVTSIGNSVFKGCSGLTSVTIPNSVTSIGISAFEECSGLTSVTISEGVTSIGSSAFKDCSSLTFITIPKTVNSIDDYVFQGCSGITSVTIAGMVTSIGNYAFYGCNSMISISLPAGLTSIGNYAFYECWSLLSVAIPNSVTNIGYNAFYNCWELKSINIPNSLTSINNYVFRGCGLTSVTIPIGVTTIGKSAFEYCSELTSVVIPNSLISIGDNAFKNCSGLSSVQLTDLGAWCNIDFSNYYSNPLSYAHHLYLNNREITELVIPDGVSSIGSYAFSECSSLISVTISNSVTSIGDCAFLRCSGLPSIAIPNNVTSIGAGVFEHCSGMTSITIPNNVTSIGEMAFFDCSALTSIIIPDNLKIIKKETFAYSGLTSITIPASVEYIYQNAFDGCTSLAQINAQPTTPPFIYNNTFPDYTVPVNVPSGCATAYQNADNWSNFTTINDGNVYYNLSITAGANGSVTYGEIAVTNKTETFSVKEGTNATLTFTPETGYALTGLTVNGMNKLSDVSGGSLTISNITANITVVATFTYAGATATVTISSVGQGTYCYNQDLDFTDVDGIKAYVASGFNPSNGNILLMHVKEVPAGTGLLVKGNAGTYTIPVKDTQFYYLNMFKPVFAATTVATEEGDNTNYVLANGSEGLKFYKSSGASLAANRAYLQIPTSLLGNHSNARSIGYTFDDEEGTTAINSINENTDEGVLYNLNGQRVTTPRKGIYVRNGKKVFINK